MSSLSSSWESGAGNVQEGLRWSGLRRWVSAVLQLFCCQASSAAWAAFLNIQLRRCLLITVECTEMGGGSGLDDFREARLQGLLREKGLPKLRLAP